MTEKTIRHPAVALSDDEWLSGPVPCPLCGAALNLDPWWTSRHWLCQSGHSYSNEQVLRQELRERGWRPKSARIGGGHPAA